MQLSEAQSSELQLNSFSPSEREKGKCQPLREEYRKAMSYFASIGLVRYHRKTGEQNTRIVAVLRN